MLTHRAPYLPNGKAYELQTWYMDGGWPHASATGAMTAAWSQGHVISLSRLGPMLYTSLEAGGAGAYGVGRTREPHFLLYYCSTVVQRNLTSDETKYRIIFTFSLVLFYSL